MASAKEIRIQIRGPSNEKKVLKFNDDITFNELKVVAMEATGLHMREVLLFTGFPPKEIVAEDGSLRVSQLNPPLRSGDSIVVEDGGEAKVEMKQGKGWEYPPTISKSGIFNRKPMPRDNSCLFHSVGYVLNNMFPDVKNATQLRELIANVVAADPHTYNSTFLGTTNSFYQQQIMDPNFWGGAVENSIFSQHFQAEIVVFDFNYLREDVFGEGMNYKRRVFVLYDSTDQRQHFDALVYTSQSSVSESVCFSTKDTVAWEKVRFLVEAMHQEAVKANKCTLQKEWRRALRSKTQYADERKVQGGSGVSGFKDNGDTDVTKRNETHSKRSATDESKETAPLVASVKSSSWSCSACTFENARSASKCAICESPNAQGTVSASCAPVGTVTSALTTTTTTTTTSTTTNQGGRDGSQSWPGGSMSPPRVPAPSDEDYVRPPIQSRTSQLIGGDDDDDYAEPGDDARWICEVCSFNNNQFMQKCEECGTTKPAQENVLNPSQQAGAGNGRLGGGAGAGRGGGNGGNGQNARSQSQGGQEGGGWFGSPRPWVCELCFTEQHPNLICCKNPQCRNPNLTLMRRAQQRQQGGPGVEQCTLQ